MHCRNDVFTFKLDYHVGVANPLCDKGMMDCIRASVKVVHAKS